MIGFGDIEKQKSMKRNYFSLMGTKLLASGLVATLSVLLK